MTLTWDEVAQAVGVSGVGEAEWPPRPNSGEPERIVPNPRPLAGEGGILMPGEGSPGGAKRRVRAVPPLSFPSVSTDTRTLEPGALFVALLNEANDGHVFAAQAVAKGAAGLVVSRAVDVPGSVRVLRVPDTEIAYGQIARLWRDKFAVPVVGVTGSVGKTTTKEMLAAVLAPLGPVLKTAASQNNETGVPKTLLQMNKSHRAAVVEMGMRGRGQIGYLCHIARPTVGVVTVIGENHLELLGTREAIADAKGELLEQLPPDGIAVLNQDDPYFAHLQAKTQARTVTYGIDTEADYRAENIAQTNDGWCFNVRGVPITLQSPSRHDIGNSLAALAVACELGVSIAEAAQALTAYSPPPMRMQITQTAWGGLVLNDAYNAAPASMLSALQTLAQQPGRRKWAFLGDMKELGALGPNAHKDLGTAIDKLGGLHALYTVGELAALIPNAAGRFHDSRAAAEAVPYLPFVPGDVVLVKGSRAMAMEQIALALASKREAGS